MLLSACAFASSADAATTTIDLRTPPKASSSRRLSSSAGSCLQTATFPAGATATGALSVGDTLAFLLFEDTEIRVTLLERMESPLGGEAFIGTVSGYDGVKNAVVLKKWIAVNLSRDHKPTEEDEARRIYKKGGRIKPFIDEETGEEVGPQRVWVKDDEVPGLAMTRSFGDRVAATVGVISEPEIKEFDFDENDKFMIIASDGIWEFIQSEECINIIGKFYLNNNIEGCCEFLYNESKKRWIKEEEVVDDITMLLAFFD